MFHWRLIVSDSLDDLGFTLTRTLNKYAILNIFKNICCKALKLLRFINNRIPTESQRVPPFKTLLFSIVHSILEYDSVLWDTSDSTARNMIKRDQKKCLCHTVHNLHIPYLPHDYFSISNIYFPWNLADRRHLENLSFIIMNYNQTSLF